MFYYGTTAEKPTRILAGEKEFTVTLPTIGPTNIASEYNTTVYSDSKIGYYRRTNIYSATTTKSADVILKVKKNICAINGYGETVEDYSTIIIENRLTTAPTKYVFLHRNTLIGDNLFEGIYAEIYESLDEKTVTVDIYLYVSSTNSGSYLNPAPSAPNKNREYENYRGRHYDYISSGHTYDIINVMKYENEPVYGRPFSLSISNRGTTTTVTRTSSPNEHATQTSLSNGDTVYYGDVLSISVSANSGYGTDWIENRSATSLTSAGTRKWTVTVTNHIDLNFYTYKKVSVTIKQLPTNCFIGFALVGTNTEVIGGTTSRDNTTTVKEGSSLYNIRIGCSKTAYNLDFKVIHQNGSSISSKDYLNNITENITIQMTKTLKKVYTVWSGNIASGWFRNGYARANFTPNRTIYNGTYTSENGNIQRITFSGKVTFGSKNNQSATHNFSQSRRLEWKINSCFLDCKYRSSHLSNIY